MRKYTNKLLEMLGEGMISSDQVVDMCLAYMSEHDVMEMLQANDIDPFTSEESDEEEHNESESDDEDKDEEEDLSDKTLTYTS